MGIYIDGRGVTGQAPDDAWSCAKRMRDAGEDMEIMRSMPKESCDLSGQAPWTECDGDWLRELHIKPPTQSQLAPASLSGYIGTVLFTTGIAFLSVWIAYQVKMWG